MNTFPVRLTCPRHAETELRPIDQGSPGFLGNCGCWYPVDGGIPRFVGSDCYASSFGLQWRTFRKTQLDSFTRTTISRDRLARMLGGSLEIVRGRTVFEAGCGAGRFSEVLLQHGAQLVSIDLSSAVDAAWENCGQFPNYTLAQADIRQLPFAPEQFDIVICAGVIQHTPVPEQTIAALCRQVRPGGMLVLDHYTQGYAVNPSRNALRQTLLTLPAETALKICETLTETLWPMHEMLWHVSRQAPQLEPLYARFTELSPIVDYQAAYGQLGPDVLRTWALLDTHDTLTDHYKHLRSAEQIGTVLKALGMGNIETVYAGNGVEARAWKP